MFHAQAPDLARLVVFHARTAKPNGPKCVPHGACERCGERLARVERERITLARMTPGWGLGKGGMTFVAIWLFPTQTLIDKNGTLIGQVPIACVNVIVNRCGYG